MAANPEKRFIVGASLPQGIGCTFETLVSCQAVIASKLAPTGIEYICKISVGWQAAFASRLAPTGIQYI